MAAGAAPVFSSSRKGSISDFGGSSRKITRKLITHSGCSLTIARRAISTSPAVKEEKGCGCCEDILTCVEQESFEYQLVVIEDVGILLELCIIWQSNEEITEGVLHLNASTDGR